MKKSIITLALAAVMLTGCGGSINDAPAETEAIFYGLGIRDCASRRDI